MLDDPPAALIRSEVERAREAGIQPGFADKVAANALGIAEREMALGPALAEAECARLVHLVPEATLAQMNAALTEAIRNRNIDCMADAVAEHLILTTLAKLAIDQRRRTRDDLIPKKIVRIQPSN